MKSEDLVQALRNKSSQSKEAQNPYTFLSQSIVDLLNFRILEEEKSSRIYLAFSLALQDKAYFNAAKLYKKYSDEELVHADKAREYLLSFNILPKTQPIPEVPNEVEGLVQVIEETLKHEALVTQQCKDLAKAALDDGDYLTFELAQFYLGEQREEMSKSYDLQNQLDTFGTDKIALRLFDNYIGENLL